MVSDIPLSITFQMVISYAAITAWSKPIEIQTELYGDTSVHVPSCRPTAAFNFKLQLTQPDIFFPLQILFIYGTQALAPLIIQYVESCNGPQRKFLGFVS